MYGPPTGSGPEKPASACVSCAFEEYVLEGTCVVAFTSRTAEPPVYSFVPVMVRVPPPIHIDFGDTFVTVGADTTSTWMGVLVLHAFCPGFRIVAAYVPFANVPVGTVNCRVWHSDALGASTIGVQFEVVV